MLYCLCQTILIILISEMHFQKCIAFGVHIIRSTDFFILMYKGHPFTVPIFEFSKNANSAYVGTVSVLYIRIVWRQLEFAFFVR